MFPERRHWAFLCIVLTPLWVSAETSPSLMKDSYPDRSALLKTASGLCAETLPRNSIASPEIEGIVSKLFHAPARVIENLTDESGWTLSLELLGSPGGYLKVIKSGAYFTMSFRQTETSIEGIADISLESQCQNLTEARFTFFNSSLRPIRRLKFNAQMQLIQDVPMEEPVKELKAGTTASPNTVRLGLIDSGIDYNHPSLIEKSRPLLGIDLTNPERPPFDYTNTVQNELMGTSFSHGTAVADIASRDVDVLLIPVRTENQSKLDGKAVKYLAGKQVRIVNISQGTSRKEDWLPLKAAIERHPEMLFIVSAGNDGKDLSKEPVYPAAFELPNMLVVASVDSQGHLSSFSNYSSKYVHFAALGENVRAAHAGGGSKTVNGTSFSTPLVTNIAVRLLIQNPSLTTQELRALLIQKAKPSVDLQNQVRFGILR